MENNNFKELNVSKEDPKQAQEKLPGKDIVAIIMDILGKSRDDIPIRFKLQ